MERLARRARLRLHPALVGLALLACAGVASAVPSYSRQTGQECAACHVGAFGPQLTPYGMKFKLGGYTDSDGNGGHVPLSGMAVLDVTHTATPDDSGRVTNKDLSEASLFLAGRVAPHVGSFTQATYDGIEHRTSLDHLDIRAAGSREGAHKPLGYGVSVNNAPTSTDPFNTLPTWRFPYVEPPRGSGVGGADLVGMQGLEGKVIGANGYMVWNNHLYGELGTYKSLTPGALVRIGATRDDDIGRLTGSDYWRIAWMDNRRRYAWSAGLVGGNGVLHDRDTGEATSRFHDVGVDGNYQYLGTRRLIGTVSGSSIRERDDVAGTSVRENRANASLYFRNAYGATLGVFDAHGTGDANDNRGYILQADWTPWGKESSWAAPWANARVGLQYVRYAEFKDETGVPLRAPDNNTLFLSLWTAF
jgi:hypothetical protein